MTPKLQNAGIDAWLVRFSERIDPAVQPWISAFCQDCRAAFGGLLVDLVPSYTTVLVQYDPEQLDDTGARRVIERVLERLAPDRSMGGGRLVEIPVWYDPSVGPELERIAARHGWTPQQVAAAHAASEYQVFALGFVPGFAFMGMVSPQLAMPRLATPRKKVPRGSIAIAERQTSAYPQQTPGGWNLVGRTPVVLFDAERTPMTTLEPGDRVRFIPVSRETFLKLGGDTSPVEEVPQ
ncbi:MAG: 5-oxoprolinase subunit PxpB [Pseudomonadota bacterium]